MKSIPYLAGKGKSTCLYVDEKPFRILGGELHNSSGSSLTYLDQVTWPAIRPLGFNTILSPVYWECLEPEEGKYDFTLVDGIIDQCRRENMKLILLWFGLWKNGVSDYVPDWVKLDTTRFFRAIDEQGIPMRLVSPYCRAGVEADKKAYIKLMEHLRDYDEEDRTVIMMQVENEVGTWNSVRDFCAEANKAYSKNIPADVAEAYGVLADSWENVFGNHACEAFMACQYATIVEEIAAAGKDVYPLPVFCNAFIEHAGKQMIPGMVEFGFFGGTSYPSGGPVMAVRQIWKLRAPSIDIMAPDIYVNDFKSQVDNYAREDNALLIPETRFGEVAAANVLYSVGAHNAVGFAPFGVDGNHSGQVTRDDIRLASAYKLLSDASELIRNAHTENRIWAFLEENDTFSQIDLNDYFVRIIYQPVTHNPLFGELERPPKARSGGFIIQLAKDDFLVVGTEITYEFLPKPGSRELVQVISKEEGQWEGDRWKCMRILNGDDRNTNTIGNTPEMQRIKLYKIPYKIQ